MTVGSLTARRFFLGDYQTDPRLRARWVEVISRATGPGPRNAVVRFDDGDMRVVPTYSDGVGATLRLRED